MVPKALSHSTASGSPASANTSHSTAQAEAMVTSPQGSKASR
jgi:hypothetical protein